MGEASFGEDAPKTPEEQLSAGSSGASTQEAALELCASPWAWDEAMCYTPMWTLVIMIPSLPVIWANTGALPQSPAGIGVQEPDFP